MTKWNKKARSPNANAPKTKQVPLGSQPSRNGPKIQYIDSFDEVNCVGPYIVKMDGSQPTANELKLNGTIYILRSEPSDEAMLDYVDKLEAAQARNDPGYAAYLARRDARESPAERRKRELAQMEASKATGDSKTVEFNPTLNDDKFSNTIDSNSSEESDNIMRLRLENLLRSGPTGTKPAIILDGKCYVIDVELDVAKIQEISRAFHMHKISSNFEKENAEPLKILTSIAHEDPLLGNVMGDLMKFAEKNFEYTAFRAPVDYENINEKNDSGIARNALAYHAGLRRHFEETLRSGPERSKPAIAIDGKCYVIHAKLDEAKIQELTRAFLVFYMQFKRREQKVGKVEDAKREALNLLYSVAEEDTYIHCWATAIGAYDLEKSKTAAFGIFRVPAYRVDVSMDTKLCTELTTGRGSGKISAVMLDGELYFLRAKPTEDNIKELARALAKFIGAKELPKHPKIDTIVNLKQSVLDKLVPIEEEIEYEKGDFGYWFGDSRENAYLAFFRCNLKKAYSDNIGCKAESNEINANHGSLVIDVVESKEESKVNSGNFVLDLDESKEESNENEEYEEVGNFNPNDIKCKCTIS